MPTSPQPKVWGYNGEAQDSSTGMIYLRARYYDTNVCRFNGEDIRRGYINNPKSLNRYEYCYNNPIMNTDISGFEPVNIMSNDGKVYGPDHEELVEQANEERREELSEEARDNKLTEDNLDEWIQTQSGHTGGLYPYAFGPAPVTPSDFVEDAETCGGGTETTVYPSEFLELVEKRKELVNQRDELKIIIDDLNERLNEFNYWLEMNKSALKSNEVIIDWSQTLSVAYDLVNVVSGAIEFVGSYGTLYGNLPEDLVSLVMSIDDMVDNEDKWTTRMKILELEDKIRRIDDETLPRLNDMVSNIETLNAENIFAPTIRSLEKKLNRKYQSLWTQYKWEILREQDLAFNPV